VIGKAKSAYALWHEYHQLLPKSHRYSLGNRIDSLFVELLEAMITAAFLPRQEKVPSVQLAIRKTDTLKVLLLILWETKSLGNKKYIALSVFVDEIGKMLGGWSGQLAKQNSPAEAGEK
jgi:hypothetical protein